MGKARDWGDVGAEGGPGAIRRKGDDPATDIPVDDAPPAQTNGEAYFSEEELRGQKQLPPPPLRGIILSKFKDVEVKRRKWIVPNYIPDETVTLLSGDGGIGKSLIAKQLAVARALSREWIGLMPEPGRTLMLSCEDDEDELLRRIDSIRKFHGAEWKDLDDSLPIDLVGEDSILLKALCRRHRQAILLLAHPSLTGMNSGTGTSGSTDWSNGVRSRLYFKPKDGAGNENIRTLQGKKSNYSEVGGPIDVVWQNGLFVPVARLTGFDKAAVEQKANDVFLALVKRFNGDRRNVIDTKGTAYAPAIFAAQPDAQGVTNEQFRAAMERLFKDQKVHIVDNGTKSKPSRTIVITESLNL